MLGMAPDDTPRAPGYRFPRYHAILLAAFLRGATVDEAAAAAGISRRQTLRWKARHASTLEEARAHLLEAAQAQLRDALPATAELVARGARDLGAVVPVALQRLQGILANPDADLALIARVAQAVLDAAARQAQLTFDIHGRLAERHEIEQRLAELERRLAALVTPGVWSETFLGGGGRPTHQAAPAA
jgi:hypothetical protein